ncbi:MAG: hypothetical protein BV459_08225 [Thermoplasmata archaeon M11B2D]|nr:MAG: hypothetical protein BV459_08225 [Thermoplasmata archaeon M11B2D]
MAKNKKRQLPYYEHFQKISPLTENQDAAFRSFREGNHLLLFGMAGTGKTFISMYLAFEQLFDKNSPYEHLVIIRSAVPSQDLGALPGTYEEKLYPYQEPYDSICDSLFKTKNNYDDLKERGFLTFMPVSYIRGITIDNSIIIVDECQNLNYPQLASVITRVGSNSRIIFCGDYEQSDLKKQSEKDGILGFTRILNNMASFRSIKFGEDDIVRSDLVKEFLITERKFGKCLD